MLKTGTKIGPYEIVAPLGAGGMGEVYRARDTRLNRAVAIKILPTAFSADPDRLARFEREAQILASLNHPHIAQIHGVEESGGVHALVMELVEGDTLAGIIARELPVEDALAIGRQIAEALEAAHEQGVIHRDLKPANIKVREDGTVKVLDFGLAKALEGPGRSGRTSRAGDELNSPTITSPAEMTAQGLILGTAAYMAPEQARGRQVDKRADIWAFGVIVFEMLTRQRLFDGDTVTDTLAAVLTRPVDVTRLPPSVPLRVRELIGRCLERDPKRRLRDIGEARLALERAAEGPESVVPAVTPVPATVRGPSVWRAGLPWGIAAAAVATALWTLAVRDDPPARTESLELEISPPAGAEFHIGSNAGHAIVSPDGSKIAFLARTTRGRSLWVRSLSRDDARGLPGTENAYYPFWSPDSATLGFFANGKLLTVDVASGLPNVIADAPTGRGGTWLDESTILFTPRGGGPIARVPGTGGRAENVTTLDAARGENAHYWPVGLPGGSSFLFFVRSTRSDNNGIYLGRVDASVPPVRVVTALSSGVSVPAHDGQPHRLLWVRGEDLFAQAFDPSNGQLQGSVSTIASDVRVEESQRSVFASASHTGTLVWASAAAADLQFAWYGRDGRREEAPPIPSGKVFQQTLSPDGRKLAFTRVAAGTADIWVHDFVTGATTQVSTSPGFDEMPAWSPDGRLVAHSSQDSGKSDARIVTLDGSAPPRILRGDNHYERPRFSADGRYVIVQTPGRDTGGDLAALGLGGDGANEHWSLTSAAGNELGATPSPDGQWLAFSTDRTGQPDVVVARLHADGNRSRLDSQWLPVSVGGGVGPRWRRDGREIIYAAPDGRLVAVAVTASGGAIQFGKPTALFPLPADPGGWQTAYTADAEHARFVVVEPSTAARHTIRVLTNWEARLGAR